MFWTTIVSLYITIGVIIAGYGLSLVKDQNREAALDNPTGILAFVLITLGWPLFFVALIIEIL